MPGWPDRGIPRLHVLAAERELADDAGVRTLERLLERAGPVAIHLRARLSARRIFDIASRLTWRTGRTGGWVVVNGRPDIALAVSTQAVQLGRGALSPRTVREWVTSRGSSTRIGSSVHGVEEAIRAAQDGADYVVLGTIHSTPSHPGIDGSGAQAVRLTAERLAEATPIPILAIGGFNPDRAREAVRAGAHGVVVGRAVWDAPDPVIAAAELQSAMDETDDENETMKIT